MFKRFKRSNLNKVLGHEAVASEVTSSHAYGRVAKGSRAVPRVHRSTPTRSRVVAGYRDSMVGSTTQYRDKMPLPPKKPQDVKSTAASEGIIGNRPKGGMDEGKTGSAADRRRHHFIEPPKRNFNRFH